MEINWVINLEKTTLKNSDVAVVFAPGVNVPLAMPFLPAFFALFVSHIGLAIILGVAVTCILLFKVYVPKPFFLIGHFRKISILVLWAAFGIALAMRYVALEWWIAGLILVLGFNAYFFVALRRAPIKLI